MGETCRLSGSPFPRSRLCAAAYALLVLGAASFSTNVHALQAEDSALLRRLPVTMKVTAHEAMTKIARWQAFIQYVRQRSDAEKIAAVNDYFNRFHFVTDATLWGQPDYWATPLQVLAVGGGDCEDLAVAKYFTLRILGISDERLRLIYVLNYDTPSGRPDPHMVLTYRAAENADQLVLDILTNEIQSLAQRKALEPVYSLNSTGLWYIDDNARDIPAGNPAQLVQWRRLSEAMGRDSALLKMP